MNTTQTSELKEKTWPELEFADDFFVSLRKPKALFSDEDAPNLWVFTYRFGGPIYSHGPWQL